MTIRRRRARPGALRGGDPAVIGRRTLHYGAPTVSLGLLGLAAASLRTTALPPGCYELTGTSQAEVSYTTADGPSYPRAVIALEGVAKRFGDRLVIAPITLRVPARTSLALVGPSGCGKSTILRLVLGLLAPDEGRVLVGGVPVTPATVIDVRRRTGYVIQEGGLFPHLTAVENVTLLARRLGWSSGRIATRVAELAALARLPDHLLDRYPGELSGGQRQRVGIMRALMLDPQLLLLDEPMGALDPLVRASLQHDLKRIFSELGKTVLLVTHSLDEAAYLGDEVALMRDGRVLQRGTMRDIVASPSDPFVREFVDAQRAPCA